MLAAKVKCRHTYAIGINICSRSLLCLSCKVFTTNVTVLILPLCVYVRVGQDCELAKKRKRLWLKLLEVKIQLESGINSLKSPQESITCK